MERLVVDAEMLTSYGKAGCVDAEMLASYGKAGC